MDVLSLLQSKNRCLKRFLDLSMEFIEQAEKIGVMPDLQSFHLRRDATLRAIDLYDRKISQVVIALPQVDRTPELVKNVELALDSKNRLVHLILTADEKIMSKIEEEKARIQRDVSSSQKAKDAMKKFKSTWVNEAGEELDETL